MSGAPGAKPSAGSTCSMTGVGTAAGECELGPVRIEVRSVNGRGLSLKLRLPPVCSAYEAAIEERTRARLARGSVTFAVERVAASTGLPPADVLRAVAHELRELCGELKLAPPGIADIVQAASSASRAEVTTSRPLPERLAVLVDAALDELVAHRRSDGAGTVAAIQAQFAAFAEAVEAVAARAPQLVDLHRQRLLQRVQEFVAQHLPEAPPAVDLVREVALFADRIDVAEELQRLRAHIAEATALLAAGGEVGRRLEFLLQELLRETNTLGSKSPDTAVAHTVVAMKSMLATIKEQVANLE